MGHGDALVIHTFGTFGGPAAEVTLAALCTYYFSATCHTKTLGGCLVRFELIFLAHD